MLRSQPSFLPQFPQEHPCPPHPLLRGAPGDKGTRCRGGAAGCVRRRRAASSFPAPPVSHGDVSPAQPAAISGSAESLVQLARWPRRTALGGPQGRLPPLRRDGGVRTAAALGRTEVGASPRPCRGCRSSSHRSSPLPWAAGLNLFIFFSFPPPLPTRSSLAGAIPRGLLSAGDIQLRGTGAESWWQCGDVAPPGMMSRHSPRAGGCGLGGLEGEWALPSAVVGFGGWHQPQIPPPGAAPVLPACCRGPEACFC